MKLLFLLSALIPLCVSEPTKPGCCVPPVWEGMQGIFVGDASGPHQELIQQSSLISYDEKKQMININVTQNIHGLTSDSRLLTDYKQGVQYLIHQKNQSCTTSKVPQTFQRFCIPENAKTGQQFHYGLLGMATLDTAAFIYTENGVTVSLTYTREECIPIGGVVLKPKSLGVEGFVNLTPGIKDPVIFDIPSICKQTNSTGFHKLIRNFGVFTF